MATQSIERLYKITVDGNKAVNNLQKLDKSAAKTSKSFTDIGKAAKRITLGVAGVASVFGGMAVAMAKSTIEMQTQARLAGVTVKTYKELAFAGNTVGLSAEKMSDQFKDVSEKIGEFNATGGGGFKDFADVMGKSAVEAKAFAQSVIGLSGKDVLIKMVKQMEGAGVSAEQMSFALEGVGSDLTNMIPLLKNSGAGFKDLSEQMASVTTPLTEDEIKAYADLSVNVDLASEAFKSLAEKGLVPVVQFMNDLAVYIPPVVKYFKDLASNIKSFATDVSNVVGFIYQFKSAVFSMGAALIAINFVPIIAGLTALKVALLANPIILIATGIATAAYLIIANWKEVSKALIITFAAIRVPMEKFLSTVMYVTRVGGESFKWLGLQIEKGLKSGIIAASSSMTEMLNGMIEGYNTVRKYFDDTWKDLKPIDLSKTFNLGELNAEIADSANRMTGLGVTLQKEWAASDQALQNVINSIVAEEQAAIQAAKTQKEADDAKIKAAEKLKTLRNQEVQDRLALKNNLAAIAALSDKLNPAEVAARNLRVEIMTLIDGLNNGNLTGEEFDVLFKKLEATQQKTKEVTAEAMSFSDTLSNSLATSVDSLADGFIDFASGAQSSFSDFAKSFLKDITGMISKLVIMNALMGADGKSGLIGGLFTANAKGNAFDGLTGLPQGVYNKPTFFNMPGGGLHKFAKGGAFGSGMGVLAEAGRSEAILPLERTINGDLGVKSSPVNVEVNNYGNDKVEVTREGDQIRIMIAAVANDILRGGGEVSRAMQQSYGVSRAGTAY